VDAHLLTVSETIVSRHGETLLATARFPTSLVFIIHLSINLMLMPLPETISVSGGHDEDEMTAWSAEERAAIARGEFFTPAELAAKPWLGRDIVKAAAQGTERRDPNLAPVSREVQELAESQGVCAYRWEPGDDRSELIEVNHHGYTEYMHPECDEAWHEEH
jgi:hypothetical protein